MKVLLTFLVLIGSIHAGEFDSLTAYPVSRIVDGDTVVLLIDDSPVKVRLIGVDTPETVHPSKPVQHYGKEASTFTRNLLRGESVYLKYGSERTDRYGRLLAYLYRAPDGLFVNAEIVRQGYGHAYVQFPFEHMNRFVALQAHAREAGKGLWAASAGETTPKSAIRDKPDRESPGHDHETVYVTTSGKKYHKDGCRYLKKSKKALSIQEAKERYTACKVCFAK
jgi:micrococcal nuclease